MEVKKFLGIITLFSTIFVYSIIVFAYAHDKFVSKDIFVMLCNRLERIETKIDNLLDK